MSKTTDRIPLQRALDIAAMLQQLWKLDMSKCTLVGSARRKCKDVGDIEFTAPFPIDGQDDELFDTMQASIGRQGGLWEDAARSISGRGIKGFTRNFKYCDLQVEIPEELIGGKAPALFPVNVQIHRYVPTCVIAGIPQKSNRGWIELMRTGPQEFGPIFLQRWKKYFCIPEQSQASKDGFLRDRDGVAIDTPTEASCFRLLNGWRHIPPEEREELAANMKKHKSVA